MLKQTLMTVCVCLVALVTANGKNAVKETKKPNIIWITCEDISPYIECYGDELVETPNIDALAKDGVKFNHAYTVAGVCAPSRACIITGMYPTSVGTTHMRTRAVSKQFGEGIPSYDALLPDYVKCFPEYLRKAGYYATNNSKQDYQFLPPVTVWDESGPGASHVNRPDGKPFFAVYNLAITHESQLMNPKRTEAFRVDPSKLKLPPFYMDTETTRHDMARLFTNIEMMDDQVGEIIHDLKEQGLYDNSIIFFYSDHGGALPWMKRELLERGTHIPLVVKFPGNKNAGTENNELVSEIDFAPSVLSLAGVPIPVYYQGQAFLGAQKAGTERKYAHGGRDRMDKLYDRVRSVRDKQFLYIYNYMPELSSYQDLKYRKGIPMMKEILALKEAGKLDNPYLASWFEPKNTVEELYDVKKDPNQLHNLANDPSYKEKFEELRNEFWRWTIEVGDLAAIPERELIKAWWNGKDEEPYTAKPEIKMTTEGAVILCSTKGASIGYRIVPEGEEDHKIDRTVKSYCFEVMFERCKNGDVIQVEQPYSIYDGTPIKLNRGDKLIVNALRIGYLASTSEFEY